MSNVFISLCGTNGPVYSVQRPELTELEGRSKVVLNVALTAPTPVTEVEHE
jgi:hypothetical protein